RAARRDARPDRRDGRRRDDDALARAAPDRGDRDGRAAVRLSARARHARRRRASGERSSRAMTPSVRIAGRRRREHALAQTRVAVALAGALGLATIELGRAWMIASTVTSAARDGARAAASLPVADRFRSGARAGQIDPTTPP